MGIEAAILGPIIGGIGGSLIGSRASKNAAGAVAGASDAATAEQRRQFDIATGLAQPGIQAGDAARNQLMQLLGISSGASSGGYQQAAQPQATNPMLSALANNGGIYGSMARRALGSQMQSRDQTVGDFRGIPEGAANRFGGGALGVFNPNPNRNPGGPQASADPLDVIRNTPGYNFQLEQGTRALNANRSAGGISGGELTKDFARFNQGVASSFYQDYANRLANLAGTGQTAATNQGSLAVQSGANIGNTLINAGNARASGILGQGNAWGNVLNDIGGFIGQNGWPWSKPPDSVSGGPKY